ncbi:MAG TPA: hypothetical protein VEH82_01015 [Acidimicrobiales bacterium]|nr:hypothetical protein [Acidimicrobiales bacterium]
MASNERIRKYLDAGNVLGQVSRGRAEEIVRELVNAGDIQRSHAQEWVDALVDRSRRTSEQITELVRREVAAQLQRIDGSALESVANQVAGILKRSAQAGASATKGVRAQAGKRAKGVQHRATQTAQGVRVQAGKTAKGVQQRATKTAKGVTTQAGKTAKGVTTQAGKTAKGVQHRATKTATRARAAATRVTPTRATRARAAATGVSPTRATRASQAPRRTTRPRKAAS